MTSGKSTPQERDKGVSPSPRSLEPVFASLLLLLAVLRAALFGCAIVPSSLTNDELLSVTKCQANGPLFALTTYDEPNNHILFNALAALLPWHGSAMPVPTRTIPMASIAALFAVLTVCPRRRGRRFEGAFLVVLENGRPLRSLVLVLAQAWSGSPVRVWTGTGSLARDPAQYGRITIAYLGDSVHRTVALRAVEGSTRVRLTDAWVYPSDPD